MIPPPTPRMADPSAPNSTVLMATLSSHPATGDAKPTVPQYTPRRSGSHPASSSRARALGVPVTDAGGNVAEASRVYVIARERKVGNFTLEFTDLAIGLSGIPIRVTVGKKTLEDGMVDVRDRATGEEHRVPVQEVTV